MKKKFCSKLVLFFVSLFGGSVITNFINQNSTLAMMSDQQGTYELRELKSENLFFNYEEVKKLARDFNSNCNKLVTFLRNDLNDSKVIKDKVSLKRSYIIIFKLVNEMNRDLSDMLKILSSRDFIEKLLSMDDGEYIFISQQIKSIIELMYSGYDAKLSIVSDDILFTPGFGVVHLENLLFEKNQYFSSNGVLKRLRKRLGRLNEIFQLFYID